MLFKICISNIRKSLRDYAIYFFTLIIGVSIFYVFNAIGTQAAYLQVSENTREIIDLLLSMLSGVSGFVSVVLGLLIVYASRFLMKRRNKEFALYLILGMGKGKISAILLLETLIIGMGSLLVGLLIGSGLSQVMSALVANLFEANMSAYRFSVSSEAILKTILYFSIMYVVLMLFNSVMIGKCKLIDLMQSDKKSEKQKLKNPAICIITFFLAAACLGYAYYQMGYHAQELSGSFAIRMIVMGAVSTLLIFWSVSGLLVRIVTSMKNVYFHSLNCFTFRQLISKINTMVISMAVICLMLFVTICTLSTAFSIRNNMNANLEELCPADCEISYKKYGREGGELPENLANIYKRYGAGITDGFSEYVHFQSYGTKRFTFADFCGDQLDSLLEPFKHDLSGPVDFEEELVRLSDYNALMKLYDREPLELQEGEYILVCDYPILRKIRNQILGSGGEIAVFGNTLSPRYHECQNGFIEISSQHLNAGVFIVPDDVIGRGKAGQNDYFIGNYAASSRRGKEEMEARINDTFSKILKNTSSAEESGYYLSLDTRIDISEATVGLGAMLSLLGLYIGLVFLIASGAILALKELSESVDSISRYVLLRKIGAEEREISRSLFWQTGLFFLLPLLLACVHTIFGMKFSQFVMAGMGIEHLPESFVFTSIIVLLIYGGYFMITYFCSKSIIHKR